MARGKIPKFWLVFFGTPYCASLFLGLHSWSFFLQQSLQPCTLKPLILGMLLTKGRMPELQSLSIFLYFLIWIIWIGVVVPSFLLVGRSILTFHFKSSKMFSGVSHSHLRWNIVNKLQSHIQFKRPTAICIKFMNKCIWWTVPIKMINIGYGISILAGKLP